MLKKRDFCTIYGLYESLVISVCFLHSKLLSRSQEEKEERGDQLSGSILLLEGRTLRKFTGRWGKMIVPMNGG